MGKLPGIFGGFRELVRRSAAYPNARIIAAGMALILIPQILVQGAVWLWVTFPVADDLPVRDITRIQVFQSWWILIFGMGGAFIAFPLGCGLLLFGSWRVWRDRRRRATPPPERAS